MCFRISDRAFPESDRVFSKSDRVFRNQTVRFRNQTVCFRNQTVKSRYPNEAISANGKILFGCSATRDERALHRGKPYAELVHLQLARKIALLTAPHHRAAAPPLNG